MQRNVTYSSSVSLVIRGFREFGMIFAEKERERRIYIILYASGRDLKKCFYNLYIAGTIFSASRIHGTMVGRNIRSAVAPFFYSFHCILTNLHAPFFSSSVDAGKGRIRKIQKVIVRLLRSRIKRCMGALLYMPTGVQVQGDRKGFPYVVAWIFKR
ncbi:hypothetical protein EZS27_010323 [termite gut metagenome]|uniref:Uncharacterized protein n=1 Tax=termite gut metagenome TaxID=433724 RepID=A0A5J4S703_9ZZZZ